MSMKKDWIAPKEIANPNLGGDSLSKDPLLSFYKKENSFWNRPH